MFGDSKDHKATGSTFAGFKIINFHNCFRNTYNDFSEIRELKSLFLKKCLYIFPIFIFKDDLCVTVMASQTVLAWPALPPLPQWVVCPGSEFDSSRIELNALIDLINIANPNLNYFTGNGSDYCPQKVLELENVFLKRFCSSFVYKCFQVYVKIF